MVYRIVVPAFEDVREIRVLEWHRRAGETFDRGDLVVELETSKAVVEVRAGQPGVMRTICCDDGAWQKLGDPLAIVSDTADETLPADAGARAGQMLADFEIV